MAGIIGLRAEDMDQVDALQRARVDYPNGFPMVRPHVKTAVLVQKADGLAMETARFGFSRKFSSINARADRLTTSPLWRSLFGKHHGLAPISYVIEWVEKGETKQPYLLQRRDGKLILAPAFVGTYHDNKDELAFAICTTEPGHFVSRFHDRIVGMCTPELAERWLRPEDSSPAKLLECVRRPAEDELVAVPVSPDITKRKAGDWSPLKPAGKPVGVEDPLNF